MENNKEISQGCLYIVSLPIGNTGDITQRARDILGSVDIILAEDTRKARDWFSRAGISFSGSIQSSHSHNEENTSIRFSALAKTENSRIAIVTDAGTPGISDPGNKVVRKFYEEKIPVIPIPGVSALGTILSMSPFPAAPSVFLGFLSPKSARRKNQLQDYEDFSGSLVIYESRHRVLSLLTDVLALWGDMDVFIGRDMTKTHEEYFSGRISAAMALFAQPRGEFTLVLYKPRRRGKIEKKVYCNANSSDNNGNQTKRG